MRAARRASPAQSRWPALSRHVEAFLEMLAAERGAARLTLAAYRNDLADFAAFSAVDASDRDGDRPSDLRRYLARWRAPRLAPRTAARRLSALRQFYRFLVLEGVRSDDPTAALDAPRLGRPLPKLLSEDEVTRLLAAARAHGRVEGVRLVCLLELLYGAGLRVSELVGAAARRGARRSALPASCAARATRSGWCRWASRRARRSPPISRCAAHFLDGRRRPRPGSFPSRGADGHLTRRRCGQLLKELALDAGHRSGAALAACAAPRLRQPSARPRRRSAQRAGRCSAMPTSRRRRSIRMWSATACSGSSPSITRWHGRNSTAIQVARHERKGGHNRDRFQLGGAIAPSVSRRRRISGRRRPACLAGGGLR